MRIIGLLINAVAVLAVCIAFAATTTYLASSENDFPVRWHPDEPGKVAQVQSDPSSWNYNHPTAMLQATQLYCWWFEVDVDDDQAVVEAGRTVSAIFAGLATFAFALTGYITARWPGLLLCGVGMTLCPLHLVFGHYLKEDAALICGMAWALLGMRAAWIVGVPSGGFGMLGHLLGVSLLGVTAAMAISGKYIGAVIVIPCALVLLFAPTGQRRWSWMVPWLIRWPVFALALGLSVAAFNTPVIQNWERFNAGVEREAKHVSTRHTDLALPVPNTFFIDVVREHTPAHIQVGVGLYALCMLLCLCRVRGFADGWLLIVPFVPAAFLTAISHQVVPFERYALPVTLMSFWMALVAFALLARSIPYFRTEAAFGIVKRLPRLAVTTILLVCVVQAHGTVTQDVLQQLRYDSRARLWAWAEENLPRDALVLADVYCALGAPPDDRRRELLGITASRLPARELSRLFASDFVNGDVTRLNRTGRYHLRRRSTRARGELYVAVCDLAYNRFFNEHVRPSGDLQRLKQRRRFYAMLHQVGERVWESFPKHQLDAFSDPVIRVYRIRTSD